MMRRVWNVYELSELLKFHSSFYSRQIFNASSDYLSKSGAPQQLVNSVYAEEMEVVKKFRLSIDFNTLPEITKSLDFKIISDFGRSLEQDVEQIYATHDNLMEIATKYHIKDAQNLLFHFREFLKDKQLELVEFIKNKSYNKKKKNLKSQLERYSRVTK